MRIKNSLKNITTGLIGQALTLILSFIVRTIFIHQLGVTYLGINGLFSNILSILSLAELGFGQAIIFSLYKPIANQDIKKICSLMQIYKKVYQWMFIVVLTLGLSLLPFLSLFINDVNQIPKLSIIYILYVISSASTYLFAYKTAFLTANQKNYISTIISYYFSVSLAICQILILILTQNFLLYLGIQIIFSILQNMIIARKVDYLFPYLKSKDILPLNDVEKKQIKKNVRALSIYKIGTLSLNSTDSIIISKFVSLTAVGIYSNYYLLTYTISGFISSIFSNLTASIGNYNASEKEEDKYQMFKVLNFMSFWIYSICSICLYICMTPFIKCWIGNDFVLDKSTCFIIALNIYIGGMLFASFNYRQTMGLFIQGKIRPIISAIENVIISIILVQYFGIAGVLWGTAITRLTTNAWYDPYIVLKKGLGKSPTIYFKDYLLKITIYCAMLATCAFITKFISDISILTVLLKAVITFFICNAIIYLIYRKSYEFNYLFNILKILKLL